MQRSNFLESENIESDRNIVAAVTKMFYEDIVKDQQPVGFYGTLKNTYIDSSIISKSPLLKPDLQRIMYLILIKEGNKIDILALRLTNR